MANTIPKCSVNKLFRIEYTHHDTNQTDKAREQNLRWEATVVAELKRKYDCNYVNTEREEESFNITNINLFVRFNKTRGIFHSVTRVLSASVSEERVSSKERVQKVSCSIPAASHVQRWALSSNNPANI